MNNSLVNSCRYEVSYVFGMLILDLQFDKIKILENLKVGNNIIFDKKKFFVH
jgi:hypothetical protein